MFNKIFGYKFENEQLPRALLLIGGGAAALWAVYFSAVTLIIPYQIEFREGTAQVITDLLLHGKNPFVFENQPLAMNNYGLGYNLIVLPFAALIGNTLLVHRAVSFIFVLLSFLLSAWVIYKTKGNLSSALTCGAFVMVGLIARAGIGAFPSATGTFFFLAAALIPLLRSYDKTGLIASALLCLIAFYTKPYFLLAFGIVASYLFLFISKKKAVFYGIFFLLVFIVSFAVIRIAFPLYFIDTITGNVSNTYRSVTHLLEQLTQLLLYFYPVLILFVVVSTVDLFTRKKDMAFKANSLSAWNLPLMGSEASYFLYFFLCSFAAFILILGLHIGAYMTYAYQIVLPPFFYWFFQKVEFKKITGVVLAGIVIFNLVSWESSVLAPDMLKQKDSVQWARLYAYLKSPSNILNSPEITSKAVSGGFLLLDSGQTAYFYVVQPYPNNDLLGPSYKAFHDDGLAYSAAINDSIKDQKFDLIFTTEGTDNFFDTNLLKEHYYLHKEIKVDMPQTDQYWPVSIWYPKIGN